MITSHSDATKERIKASLGATREKRRSQKCVVHTVKVTLNKTDDSKIEKMIRLFLEAKWYKNNIIASEDIAGFDIKTKVAKVKMPDDTFEERELKVLGSHMKHSIHAQVKSDLTSLSETKKRGRKVGALSFSKEEDSIDLKEYGNTYKVDREGKRVHIQKIGWLRVRGLDNIPDDAEFANAKFVHKPDGYYIHITTYVNKDDVEPRAFMPGTVIGIDMGLSTQITTSEGDKINLYVEESDHLRRLKKRLSRQKRGSNNYIKTRNLIRREYQKMEQKKDDYAKKIVSDLSRYEVVFFQDENLSSWKCRQGYVRGGKKIQQGILGRVKALLKTKDWAIMLPRNITTTQTCVCGVKNKHHVDKRTYFCSTCGYTEDRDIHAARNMITFGFSDKRFSLPLEQGEVKPAERSASGLHFSYIEVCGQASSMKQETHRPPGDG